MIILGDTFTADKRLQVFIGSERVKTITKLGKGSVFPTAFKHLSALETLTISTEAINSTSKFTLAKCPSLQHVTIIGSPSDVTVPEDAWGWPGHTSADIVWQDEYTP